MIATATSSARPLLPHTQQISWEDFQRKYLSREDRFKYEWVQGQVEKTSRNMDKSQLYILVNLTRFLYGLKSVNPNIKGDLIAEGDTFFVGNHRRPDIAFWTDDQIAAGRREEEVVPDFVIEIISKNDQVERVEDKMEDYLAAGVKVVWKVLPRLQRVDVYRGRTITVCKGQDLCSAEPVIEGFVLTAADVFK